MTFPNENVLSRELDDHVINLLSLSADTIDICIDFGTHVYTDCIADPKGTFDDSVPILMFRHILDMLDGVSILIRQCSIDPGMLILRSALEAILGLEYLMQDKKRRSKNYLFIDAKQKIDKINRIIPKLEQSDKIKAEEIIIRIQSWLKQPKYSKIEIEWEKQVERQKKRFPKWYSFYGGPRNLNQLSKKVGKEDWYNILYSNWSEIAHVTNAMNYASESEIGTTRFIGIRSARNLVDLVTYTIAILILSYKIMIHAFTPENIEIFHKWYYTHIHKVYSLFKEGKINIITII